MDLLFILITLLFAAATAGLVYICTPPEGQP